MPDESGSGTGTNTGAGSSSGTATGNGSGPSGNGVATLGTPGGGIIAPPHWPLVPRAGCHGVTTTAGSVANISATGTRVKHRRFLTFVPCNVLSALMPTQPVNHPVGLGHFKFKATHWHWLLSVETRVSWGQRIGGPDGNLRLGHPTPGTPDRRST
ncbi:hypothetical protein V8E52_011009 [Russula decolorans]